MPDPTTTAKGFIKPTVGSDNNIWGGLLNTNFDLIDSAVGGTLTKSISGTTTSLSGTDIQNTGYVFTGSLAALNTITWSAFSGFASITNSTTGNQLISCGISGGTYATVRNGESALIWSNGTNFSKIAIIGVAATRQTFLSGSGTYTLPTGCIRIVVTVKAGGAGGAGGGSGAGSGSIGNASSFNSVFAAGGNGGAAAGSFGLGGRGGNGGSGTPTQRIPGSSGGFGAFGISGIPGGTGGGCGGAPSGNGGGNAGANAITNSGGGGSGAPTSDVTLTSGGGGGEGEIFIQIINSPASTYAYAVGAGGSGGSAGSGGGTGGNGGAGYITVDEYYI